MKILITGSSGFVGSNLIASLKHDHQLFFLDVTRNEQAGKDAGFLWNELEQIPEVDSIIHLAGKAHDTANTSHPDEYFKVNLDLSRVIFDYFVHSKTTSFIFFSSVKAVADNPGETVVCEDHRPTPLTPYGQSKLAAENYMLSQSLSAEKRLYILRPCMIHGPGNKGNLNLLYSLVSKRIPWPLGSFSNDRSFVSIHNVAFVVNQLMIKQIAPGIYNLADDTTLSTNKIIELMAASLQRKPHIWKVPRRLITLIASSGDVLHLPLNTERLKKLTESYIVSNKKIKSALNITKMPVDTTEGFRQTLKNLQL